MQFVLFGVVLALSLSLSSTLSCTPRSQFAPCTISSRWSALHFKVLATLVERRMTAYSLWLWKGGNLKNNVHQPLPVINCNGCSRYAGMLPSNVCLLPIENVAHTVLSKGPLSAHAAESEASTS
jgi:hypothetical protein